VTPLGAIARFLYGAGFAVGLPIGLVIWARALDPTFPLAPLDSAALGWPLATLGMLTMLAAIGQLVMRGRGLPMNAFPPPRLVRTGLYRWIAHPIYLGFGMVVTGWAIGVGSAAGLWLVTPMTILGMAALVVGYERADLSRRFGEAASESTLLSLPPATEQPARPIERVAVFLKVLLPWLVIYFAVQALGRAPDVFVTSLPFESSWPVIQWTELLYLSTYLFVPLTPLLIRTSHDLRRFAHRGLVATVVVTLCWLVIPVVADNRSFAPSDPFGRLLAFEQSHSRGVAAFPAFHVLWALIAAQSWVANGRSTNRRHWSWIGVGWAVAITLSTLTTAMHTVIEVIAALALFLPIRNLDRTWDAIRRATEWLANSWREWRIGPIRVIDHGLYAAAAAGIGTIVAASALGSGPRHVIFVGIGILLGAGLLAQWLEGSSKLLRPFGWYGGVIGGVAGAFAARIDGAPVLPLLASFTVAAPWIQIGGRLRCLVQGCCHGGPAPAGIGIAYRHPRSRVARLAGLAGIPIHPTPLYSIAGNLVIGLLLFRLRMLGAADSLILGGYLMLSGMARFVEESYRAEPQTPILGGLRLYQWLGIASVLAGILCTLLPAQPRPAGFAPLTPGLLFAALAMATLTGFLMGVDFPGSNRRFSRLAAAD